MSHSRLAASAAPRWIRCPGSVAYIEFLKKEKRIPEDFSNFASIKGTAIHSIIEHCILQEIHPQKLTKSITPCSLLTSCKATMEKSSPLMIFAIPCRSLQPSHPRNFVLNDPIRN